MSFEEGDCFQSWVGGGIIGSQTLPFEGEAQTVGEGFELAAD